MAIEPPKSAKLLKSGAKMTRNLFKFFNGLVRQILLQSYCKMAGRTEIARFHQI